MTFIARTIARLGDEALRNRFYAVKEIVRAQPRPILIYQMAKVGSTSVYTSMRRAGLYPLHVHEISGGRPTESVAFYEDRGVAPTIDVFVGRLLHPYLQMTSHRIKVISLVREPVARYLSKMYHLPDAYDIASLDLDASIQKITNRFADPSTFTGMFTWFDREIKRHLDVDVMAGEFDRESGYSLYHGPRCEVLVVKLERLTDLLPTVISDFVETPLEIVRANVGARKKSASAYKSVKTALSLPDATLDGIYTHPWVRHFYTGNEIQSFRERWS